MLTLVEWIVDELRTAPDPRSQARGGASVDLAVANGGSNNVSVLLGNGDGTFQAAVNFAVDMQPMYAAIGDFNGDGAPDLAVANFGSNDVSIRINNSAL